MGKINQNKNSKQQDPPDAVCKLYFTLEVNETFELINICIHVLQNRCSQGIRKLSI